MECSGTKKNSGWNNRNNSWNIKLVISAIVSHTSRFLLDLRDTRYFVQGYVGTPNNELFMVNW